MVHFGKPVPRLIDKARRAPGYVFRLRLAIRVSASTSILQLLVTPRELLLDDPVEAEDVLCPESIALPGEG